MVHPRHRYHREATHQATYLKDGLIICIIDKTSSAIQHLLNASEAGLGQGMIGNEVSSQPCGQSQWAGRHNFHAVCVCYTYVTFSCYSAGRWNVSKAWISSAALRTIGTRWQFFLRRKPRLVHRHHLPNLTVRSMHSDPAWCHAYGV